MDFSCGECYCPVTDEGMSPEENARAEREFEAGELEPGGFFGSYDECDLDGDCRCHRNWVDPRPPLPPAVRRMMGRRW
jgi:hypothetical protein